MWEDSIIKLISAEAEAEVLLGLAELGNIKLKAIKSVSNVKPSKQKDND